MHIVELKGVVKDLFGDGTESEYLKYFTAKFAMLLMHCYIAVEKEAQDLMPEYFLQDASAPAPTVAVNTRGLELKGSELTINCADDITFPKTKFQFNSLIISNISRLFFEQNKSFSNFLQLNRSNITQLKFSLGSSTFESVDKILQKLPNLKEIEFDRVEYGAAKAVLATTCRKIWSADNTKPLQVFLQSFLECKTVQKLNVVYPAVSLEEILQKNASLEELHVVVGFNYPVSRQHEAHAKIHQLKVLRIRLYTENGKIHKHLISDILKLNNLQQFYFGSNYSLSQALCQQLAAHICQLGQLISLTIYNKHLLEEVLAFVANNQEVSTRLKEFEGPLRHFLAVPPSFLGYFTNLRKLNIDCFNAQQTKVEDLINFMNQSQLTSVKLGHLPAECFSLLKKLHIKFLQMFKIHIKNEPQVPAFEVLQEFLLRHPKITQFKIRFWYYYDEPESLELIPMILETLPQLERLEVGQSPKITADVIKQIAALETLTFWEINEHKSENFYRTQH